MWTVTLLLGLSLINPVASAMYSYSGKGETREYWLTSGRDELQRARKTKPNIAVAKNVILFLGDGMGVSTVTAARIMKGQMEGNPGEESSLSFEDFPHVGLSKTYNQDAQTPDSAGTSTAFNSGIKTNIGVLGLDARSRRGDCSSQAGTEVETMLDWAHAKGKSVGIVTTTRITHATPAALYAKSPERNWESDVDIANDNVTGPCTDIAKQLIDNNPNIRVILGGGRTSFLRNSDLDPESGSRNSLKQRNDSRNLIQDWVQKQASLSRTYRYVWNASEFHTVDPAQTDYLLGLFSESHMQYEVDRASDVGGEPSIAELTEKAIQILSKNPKGYYLLVEGGRIDHGHHLSQAKRALQDTIAFSDAVQKGIDLTSEADTLLIATADHGHVFSIGGYPTRGNPILGLTDDRMGNNQNASDGKPFTTLLYANGNGSYYTVTGGSRPDPSLENQDHKEFTQQSAVPLDFETHAGADVAIYARGPMSHLIHSVHEQSYIAHVMAYASCIGIYSEDSVCAMADVKEIEVNHGVMVRLNSLICIALVVYL